MTITDHLAASREQQTLANETPTHRLNEVLSYLLCALENLTEATDLLHQRSNQQSIAIEGLQKRETFALKR